MQTASMAGKMRSENVVSRGFKIFWSCLSSTSAENNLIKTDLETPTEICQKLSELLDGQYEERQQKCLRLNQKERLSINEFLQHPYLTEKSKATSSKQNIADSPYEDGKNFVADIRGSSPDVCSQPEIISKDEPKLKFANDGVKEVRVPLQCLDLKDLRRVKVPKVSSWVVKNSFDLNCLLATTSQT